MISKTKKQILKWVFVVVIIGAIIYTFRDSAGPILEQLKQTTPAVIAGICAMTVIYHVIEGVITTLLAKQYHPEFTYGMGISNAFFCSFYRVATLGSGSGIAAIVYLGDHGVQYSESFGLYMLQYAFHKISIAIFSMILFALNWNYMCTHFGEYMWLLVAGYVVTLIITIFLILFSCSVQFHRIIFVILDFVNGKCKGRFDVSIQMLREQCQMLEEASKYLLKKKRLVAGTIVLNLMKFVFWYAMPYLVFRGATDVTVLQTMAVTSLSVMLAAVLPAPAGIGSTEFVFTALFSGIAGTGLAGSASLLYRFGTFVFPFLVGGVVVVGRRIRKKQTSLANA